MHPFAVYNYPNDPSTMRMLIRPTGQFTKALRSSLVDLDKRPLILIDGFYRGGDHCQQALMMHDHVSIIAGGVALTPFLSMMFAVPKEQALPSTTESLDGTPILQSMTLIWSCRELGLLSFVKVQYHSGMVAIAGEIENYEFKIKIHHTGTLKNLLPVVKEMSKKAKIIDDDKEAYSESPNEEAKWWNSPIG